MLIIRDLATKHGDNYKAKYGSYKQLISSCSQVVNYPVIIEDLEKTIDLIQEGKLDPAHKENFLNESLKEVIKAFLGRKCSNYEKTYRPINLLFCFWMHRRLKALDSKNSSEAAVLRLIFSPGKLFYDTSNLASTPMEDDYEQDVEVKSLSTGNKDLFTLPWKSCKCIPFAFNINFFGRLGGFSEVLGKVNSIEPKASDLIFIKRLLRTIANMSEYLSKEQWEKWGKPLGEAGISYIIRMNETELKLLNEKDTTKFIRVLHILVKGEPSLTQGVGELELGIAVRLTALPSLQKKLVGIAILVGKLNRFQNKWPTNSSGNSKDAYLFAEYLCKNKFVELIFGDSIREEILNKAVPLLVFLYCWKMIIGKDICAIWDLAMSKYEYMQKAIMNAISSIALHMTSQDSNELFVRVKAVPLARMNDHIVGVLNALAKNEYFRNKKNAKLKNKKEEKKTAVEGKLLGGTQDLNKIDSKAKDDTKDPVRQHVRTGSGDQGRAAARIPNEFEMDPFIPDEEFPTESYEIFNYVWWLTQEGAQGLSITIQTQILDNFLSLLSNCYPNKRADYLHICEGMLASDKSPVQFSKIYIRIIDMLKQDPNFKLQTSIQDFLSKIIINLIELKRKVAIQAVEKINDISIADVYENIITNPVLKLNYYKELEQRFDFIKCLVGTCWQPLTQDSVLILWKSFLINSFSDKEVDIFLTFMHSLIKTGNGLILAADQVFDSFFFEVLLKLEYETYSEHAFGCLKELFVAINSSYKQIKIVQNGSLEIIDLRLIGFETVWQIALHAKNTKVQKLATDFIYEVYKRVTPQLLASNGPAIRQNFLTKCMDCVKSGINGLAADKNNLEYQEKITKGLSLLTGYIDKFEKVPLSASQAIPDYQFNLNVTLRNGDKHVVQVSTRMKVVDALEKIITECKCKEQVNDLLFMTQGRVITPMESTLYENNIRDTLTMRIEQPYRDDSIPNNQPSQPVQAEPTMTESEIDEAVKNLQDIVSVNPNILKAALKKAKYDLNQAIIYATDDYMVSELEQEVKLAENAQLVQTVNKHADNLSEMLANHNEYFILLYDLLVVGTPDIVKKVWDLIMDIPINDKLQSNVFSLNNSNGEQNWKNIYALDSPYKLAYNLKIIQRIIFSPENEKKIAWMNSFITFGGLAGLISILNELTIITANLPSGDINLKTFMQCLELVVKITNEIIKSSLIATQSELYAEYIKMTAPKQEKKSPLIKKNKEKENNEKKQEELILSIEQASKIKDVIYKLKLLPKNIQLLSQLNEDSFSLHQVCLLMLINTICMEGKWIEEIYISTQFQQYLCTVLLKSKNDKTKQLFVTEMTNLSKILNKIINADKSLPTPEAFYLNSLTSLLPSPDISVPDCEIYFNFFCDFLEIYLNPLFTGMITKKAVDLSEQLIHYIQKSLQQVQASNIENHQLAGYLKLLAKLIEVDEESVAILNKNPNFDIISCISDEVYGSEGKPHNLRKCVTQSTMRNAIKLIYAIAKKSPIKRLCILPKLVKFHEAQLKCAIKDTGIDGGFKAPGSYVGLHNLGCTCYINSVLQQLFMMPELRYGILQLETGSIADSKCDHVLANLQRMFATLLLSKNEYYSPTAFCQEFKAYDGQPINVHVQQDGAEFYNLITGGIENEMKLLEKEKFLQNALEVVLCHEITSLESDIQFTSTREEPCHDLPVDIKGVQSLEEAMDNFVKGELLEGENKYFCEQYQKKISVTKRCTLKVLPRTMVINLKRFEFNYNTMQRKKVNDYCEFPEKINFYKWTKAGQDNISPDNLDDYEFELAGIVVHSGTAEGGHYYSYIKEREPASLNYGKWFEFNDLHVKPAKMEDIKKDAFGSKVKNTSAWDRDANAYLLIYQKISTDCGDLDIAKSREKYTTLIEKESENLTNQTIYLDTEYSNFVKQYISLWKPEIITNFEVLDSDNYELRKGRVDTLNILSSKMSKNIASQEIIDEDEIINTPSSPCLTICKLAVKYTDDLMIKAKAATIFKDWINLLIPHIKSNALFSLWLVKFMTKHKTMLFEILMENPIDDSRDLFINALGTALTTVSKIEEPYFAESDKILIPSSDPTKKIEKVIMRSAAVRFAKLLAQDGLSHARANWKRFDQYFILLAQFASLGVAEVNCLIQEGFIYQLIDFIANTASSLQPGQGSNNRPLMGEMAKDVSFKQPIFLLSALIRSCSSEFMKKRSTCPDTALYSLNIMPDLPEKEVEFLFSTKWKFPELLKHNKEEMIKILIHITWENSNMIVKVMSSLTICLFEKRVQSNYQFILEALKALLLVKDSHDTFRVLHFCHTELECKRHLFENLNQYKDLSEGFVLDVIYLIAEIIGIEKICAFLKDEKKGLMWVPIFLKSKKSPAMQTTESQRKIEFVKNKFAIQLDIQTNDIPVNEEIKK